MLQPRNTAVHGILYIFRHWTWHSTKIHFISVKSFRFYKYLMSFFIRKSYNFIFNWRTISWTCSVNNSSIERRTVKIISYNLMCLFICVCKPAWNLVFLYCFRVGCKWKWHYSFITKLLCHLWKINRTLVNSRRCTCLKSSDFNSIINKRLCKVICRKKSVWTCFIAHITKNTLCLEIYTCTKNNCFSKITCTWYCLYTFYNAIFNYYLWNFSLTH